MSVGHLARTMEEAGISTVIVTAAPFRDRLEAMSPPRLLVTPNPMGRPMGLPNDAESQRMFLEAALDLLENAEENGTVAEMIY